MEWYAFQYTGSVPLPQMAKGWQALVPDAPERMLAMAEKEQTHRHGLDKSYVVYRFFAQGASFVLAAIVLVGGVWAILAGKDAYGLAAIIAALVGFVAIFLVRQFGMNGSPNGSSENGNQQQPPQQ